MAEPKTHQDEPEGRRLRADPLLLAGGGCFAVGVLAAVYPAVTAGPATAGALLLLLGLAGVAFLALFAFRQPAAGAGLGAEAWLEALAEPAAVLSVDGRPMAANAAWRALPDAGRRLGRANGGAALFAALKAAAPGAVAEADLPMGGRTWRASASRLDDRRLLVRPGGARRAASRAGRFRPSANRSARAGVRAQRQARSVGRGRALRRRPAGRPGPVRSRSSWGPTRRWRR